MQGPHNRAHPVHRSRGTEALLASSPQQDCPVPAALAARQRETSKRSDDTLTPTEYGRANGLVCSGGGARAAFFTPRGLDNTVDKSDTLLRFGLSRTLEATIHQHDVQTCSLPHGSDQDETQLHSVCSRALETTIHQIDVVTFSQPQLDHQTNSALHGVDAMKTGQSWREFVSSLRSKSRRGHV